jgi:hypothetical protein
MEAACSSETLLYNYKATLHIETEDRNLKYLCCFSVHYRYTKPVKLPTAGVPLSEATHHLLDLAPGQQWVAGY